MACCGNSSEVDRADGVALEGAKPKAVRTMQLFISDGTWEDDALLERHWQEVETLRGEDDGVLTLDGSDFLKQGQNRWA